MKKRYKNPDIGGVFVYIPERHPVDIGVLKCELCNDWATHYELPIEGDQDFHYAACNVHWQEHDEMNG
ncbi:hypothetical protein [Paenibacillus chitinolyticus]|uniref:hypothetical protein n=1 Tax=Paenibacillus chitinolyticus TaxID=79263 RepID=UPI00295EDF8D|nr:hypothetical protein [Paenibacillus chitinolyticus]